jgi:hypothetical protein
MLLRAKAGIAVCYHLFSPIEWARVNPAPTGTQMHPLDAHYDSVVDELQLS